MPPPVIAAIIAAGAAVVTPFVSWQIFKRTSRDARIAAELTAENAKAARIDQQGQVVFENLERMYKLVLAENAALRDRLEAVEAIQSKQQSEIEQLHDALTTERQAAALALKAAESAEARAALLQRQLDDCLKSRAQSIAS